MALFERAPASLRDVRANQDAMVTAPTQPAWLSEPEYEPEVRAGKRKRTRYRTVWISDIHLGTPGCNADMLMDFLKSIEWQRA